MQGKEMKEKILMMNKALAVFMGYVKVEEKYSKLPCYYYPCAGGHMQITDEDFNSPDFDVTNYAWTVYQLAYDTDWTWIMDVVHKILAVYPSYKMITECTDEEISACQIFHLGITAHIMVVFSYCFKFIEWYNKQPKPLV